MASSAWLNDHIIADSIEVEGLEDGVDTVVAMPVVYEKDDTLCLPLHDEADKGLCSLASEDEILGFHCEPQLSSIESTPKKYLLPDLNLPAIEDVVHTTKNNMDRDFDLNKLPIRGYVQIPVGIAGPLLLDGREFSVPMATIEGCLVASTNRGFKAIHLCGGASSVVLRDAMTRAPVVRFATAKRAAQLKMFLEDPANFELVSASFNKSSRFGRLQSIKCAMAGKIPGANARLLATIVSASVPITVT